MEQPDVEDAEIEKKGVTAVKIDGVSADGVQSSLSALGCCEPGDTGASAKATTSTYDGWELEQRLLHIERMLSGCSQAAASKSNGTNSGKSSQSRLRHDAAHPVIDGLHARTRPERRLRRSKFSQTVVWSTLLLGVTTLACGSFLVGWSRFSGRDDLGEIGLPIALTGGICLLVSLIVQVDRLLNDNRLTVAKLDMVDNQLHRLAATAAAFDNTQRHAPSDAFYAHLAGGANPQLLLSDLKSQLDLLAVQIGRREVDVD